MVVQMSGYSDGVLSFSGSSDVRLFRMGYCLLVVVQVSDYSDRVLSFSCSSDVRLFRWGIIF